MKKVLCCLGIILLIFLIALPPVLRIVLPAKEEVKEEVKLISKTLSCDSKVFLSRTSYENDVVKTIVIKKTFTNTNLDDDTNTDTEADNENETDTDIEETPPAIVPDADIIDFENTDLAKIFEEVKKDSRVVIEEVEDGEIIKIDFTVSDYSGLEVEDLNKTINDQFKYYEDNGLVCSILE